MTNWLRGMIRIGAFATGRSELAADREGYFDSDGVRIHYAVYGAGEPVVLVHGYGVTADINWRLPGLIPAFAKRYQVNVLDVRGHGRSGKPHDPAQYGVKMSEDVVRADGSLEDSAGAPGRILDGRLHPGAADGQ